MKNENMDNVITTEINESYGAIPSGTIAMPYQGSDIPLRDTNRSLMETKISHPVSSGGKGSFINTLVGRIAQLMRTSLLSFLPLTIRRRKAPALSRRDHQSHRSRVFGAPQGGRNAVQRQHAEGDQRRAELDGDLHEAGSKVRRAKESIAERTMDRKRLAIGDLRAANSEEDGLQGEEKAELYGIFLEGRE